LHRVDEGLTDLCLIVPIGQQIIAADAQFRADFLNRAFLGFAGNLDVGFVGHCGDFPVIGQMPVFR